MKMVRYCLQAIVKMQKASEFTDGPAKSTVTSLLHQSLPTRLERRIVFHPTLTPHTTKVLAASTRRLQNFILHAAAPNRSLQITAGSMSAIAMQMANGQNPNC